ncbi:hypothetical protein BN134_1138 [Cronobacter dublinensis 1210]|uniref:Uncharacterized protein n=1 Tax=Cronobacter dublinensis 1210 TaxID=1208656 RepID=A0ABP1W7R2_9ENTR|nr:hypothetical protein [Cronobacter dublinensis]ALB67625.1 hypothetical protein AFK67_14545 [Cronobacter dublinensis subsp. dublinensis LMG 23823]MDI7270290.1 hypothetical protein [Cronobacter dublinensis]CCJ80426.1 hypothetical protein BN134_1138 [Cronobacter dublinensis 1210]
MSVQEGNKGQNGVKGRCVVTTADFVHELGTVNWNWTLKQANEWMDACLTTFKDISTEEGENRTLAMYNPNGGI